VGLGGNNKPIDSIIQIYLSIYLFATIIGTYISSYFQIPLISILSFNVADGWCTAETQGVGAHCFGDFYYTLTFLDQSNPWSTAVNPYPPVALLIFKPFAFFVELFPSSQFALYCYLGFLIASILSIPVHLFISKKMSISFSTLVGMLILSSTPMIVGLDRGNLVVLCIPIIYFFLHYEREGDAKRSFVFWMILVLIKPQFALLGIIFLRNGNIKSALKRATLGFSLFCASFLIYPNGMMENLKAYFKQLVSYQDYGTLGNVFPVNISLASALSLVSGFDKTILAGAAQLFGFALLIVTVIVVYRSPAKLNKSIVLPILLLPIILPQTTWHYYLLTLIPFFIFEITNATDTKLGKTEVNKIPPGERFSNLSQIALCAWAILLFVPWSIPWNVFAGSNVNFGSLTISMHWLLVVWSLPIIFIGSLVFTEFSKRVKPRN
jgi:hypothetical protein